MATNDKIDKAAGKAKEAAGKISGDDDLEQEGQTQHDVSRAKESVEDAGRKIKDAAKNALSGKDGDESGSGNSESRGGGSHSSDS